MRARRAAAVVAAVGRDRFDLAGIVNHHRHRLVEPKENW